MKTVGDREYKMISEDRNRLSPPITNAYLR
jgi:hypothetical protein